MLARVNICIHCAHISKTSLVGSVTVSASRIHLSFNDSCFIGSIVDIPFVILHRGVCLYLYVVGI